MVDGRAALARRPARPPRHREAASAAPRLLGRGHAVHQVRVAASGARSAGAEASLRARRERHRACGARSGLLPRGLRSALAHGAHGKRRAARDVPSRVEAARSRFSAAPTSAIGSTGRIYRARVTRAALTARQARRYGWRHDRGRTRHRADRARPHRAGRSRADPDARAPAVRHPPSLAAQAGRPRARAGARHRVGDQLRDGQGRGAQLPARRARRGRRRGAPHGDRGRAQRGRSLVRRAQPRSAGPRRDRPRERRARDHGLRALCRGVPGPRQRHPDHRGSRRGDGRGGDRRRVGHRRARRHHRRDRLPGAVDGAGAAGHARRGAGPAGDRRGHQRAPRPASRPAAGGGRLHPGEGRADGARDHQPHRPHRVRGRAAPPARRLRVRARVGPLRAGVVLLPAGRHRHAERRGPPPGDPRADRARASRPDPDLARHLLPLAPRALRRARLRPHLRQRGADDAPARLHGGGDPGDPGRKSAAAAHA